MMSLRFLDIRLPVMLCLVATYFFVRPAHATLELVECDKAAIEDITWVINFATTHASAILDQADFLPTKHKDKLKELLNEGKIYCRNKAHCGPHSGLQHGRDIYLCWSNVRSLSMTRCDLVGELFHEKAHEAGVPDEAKHNEGETYPSKGYAYVWDTDMVIRFDRLAANYCAEIASTGEAVDWSAGADAALAKDNSKKFAIGEFCSKDSQCTTQKCEKGVCTCQNDKDCAGKMRCVNRIGKNFCVPPANSLGSYCQKNSDCQIGTCNSNLCVCDKDDDCNNLPFVGANPRCAKPFAKKNFCQSTNVSAGGYCQKDSDCASRLRCRQDLCSK